MTITGNPESQWKAQYLIFEKLREEGFFSRQDLSSPASSAGGEVRLTAEILVPATQVGRIIGKGGANVRDLQRATGAAIKLPEQGSVVGEETPVHITGTFYSVQSAQRRLRAMILTSAAAAAQIQQQQQQQQVTVATATVTARAEESVDVGESEDGAAVVAASDGQQQEGLKLEDSSEC